jgi:hypothetical protein
MAFIAGKGFAILNSKAEKGDQKAKDLLAKLDSIDQDEADRLFSEILGKGGGGGSKSKKTKAPGASATDKQGEITEGDGEQAPTGKTAPKAKGEAKVAAPDEPTGEVKPQKDNKRAFKKAAEAAGVELIFGKNLNKQLDDLPSTNRGGVLNNYDAFYVAPDGSKVRYKIRGEKITDEKGNEANSPEEFINAIKGGKSKAKPADPLSNDNLQALFDSGLDTDGVIDELRKQTSGLEADPESPLAGGDIQGIVEAFEMGYVPGGKKPQSESNVPSQFKDGNDAAKFGVFMSVKDAIDDDLDFDENEIKQIANEYGVSTKEVSQIIRGYQKRKQGGTQIDTAGANVQPAGAFGDIEPETQQLAGVGNVYDQEVADELGVNTEQLNELLKPTNTNTPENPEDPANVQQVLNSVGGDKAKALQIIKGQQAVKGGLQLNEKTIKEVINQVAAGETNPSLPASEPTAEQLAGIENLTPDEIDRQEFEAIESATNKIDELKQQGRISNEEAEQVAREFQIPVADVLDIIGDQDNASDVGNVYDQEVADELGVNEQELGELLGPNFLQTLGQTYQGAPWEEENIKNILQQASGDKAKALELLKQQQAAYADKGPILKDQYLPGLIEQAAAGETNLSLPASEPTAEQLAETDSLFENTPEKEMVAAEQLAAQPAAFENDNERIGAEGFLKLSNEIDFNESVITNDQIQQVGKQLKLEGKTKDELRQIRDGVVKAWDNLEPPNVTRKARTALSAVTAAIDSYIFRKAESPQPAQSQNQIKQTAQANAQQAAPQSQQQQATAAKPDRQKLERAAADLGVDANLLEGLLELLKKVR